MSFLNLLCRWLVKSFLTCLYSTNFILLWELSEIIYVKCSAQCKIHSKCSLNIDHILYLPYSLSSGDSDHNWKIAHVTLKEEKKFRYLFQGTKGDPQNSAGGIHLDDITLTETPCPAGVWTIRNISQVLQNTIQGDKLMSPRFYNSEGYGFGVTLYPHGRITSSNSDYLGLAFHLCSGENDAILEWPVENRQAVMTILDQETDAKNRMSLSLMFTTSQAHTSSGKWFSLSLGSLHFWVSGLSINKNCPSTWTVHKCKIAH